MNKELELEAEKHGAFQYGNSCGAKQERQNCIEDFIAGATSKYVEKQRLEFAIEVLKLHIKHPCEPEQNRLDILTGIEYLEQKLLKL